MLEPPRRSLAPATSPTVSDPGQSPQIPRQNGWKDIANHLGKGVRTVQRWEKVYGLPVHRIGGDGGEIVYAYRHEVDAWLAESERARAGDARSKRPTGPERDEADAATGGTRIDGHEIARPATRHTRPAPPRLLLAASALLVIVLAALGWLASVRTTARPWTSTPHATGLATSWRFEYDRLKVLDAEGRVSWTYPVDPLWAQGWLEPARPGWLAPVVIVDLDGDGPREVLLSVPYRWPRGRRLVCLNADGTTRWTREPDDRQRFGEEWYSGPWTSSDFKVSPRPDGTSVVWAVFHHHLLFPSVLEQIAPDGRVLSRYWSNGYVDSLSEATWQGREVLLVGAANNEHKGASLAILDRADASGNAPASNPRYRCATCPGPDPMGFVVFPPTPVGRVRDESGSVRHAWVNADGEIVAGSFEPVAGFGDAGMVFFTLDRQLRLRNLEVAASYRLLHDRLFKAGRIDRPYSPAEERLVVPLLRWDGTRFVEAPLAR